MFPWLLSLTLSGPENLKISFFEMPIIPQTLNNNNLRTTNAKSINLYTVINHIKYSLKKHFLKAMFTVTVFEILLFVERTKSLKLLEKWLAYKLRRFWVVFNLFWSSLTLSIPEKLKNLIFEMPIIPQTLNNIIFRTTNTKSINLHTIRSLTKYSLKNFFKGNVYSLRFRDIAVRGKNGIITSPAGCKERKG